MISIKKLHTLPRKTRLRKIVLLLQAEELGLSPEALDLAVRQAGRISIPMAGAKRSLNVAVAVGIVLQVWYEQLRVGKADRPPR